MRPADPDAIARDVGRRVAELRARAGLTQDEFAAKAEVGVKYVQRIERGDENLGIHSLVRLANLLHAPVIDFFQPPASKRRKTGRPPKSREE